MLRDIENFSKLSNEAKKYFYQKLNFQKQMMLYGLTSQTKTKSIKNFILSIINELIIFNLCISNELSISKNTEMFDYASELSVSIKANLRVMNCCFEILKVSNQFSLYYKKNFLLKTFFENINDIKVFEQRTSKLMFGIGSKLEQVKTQQNQKILNQKMELTKKRNSLENVYSGKGRRSTLQLKF